MELANLGSGAVRLSVRKFNVVIGPKLPDGVTSDLVALTQASEVKTDAMVVDGPGEYEVGGVLLTGIAAQLHADVSGLGATIYSVLADEVNVVVLANIAPGLSNEQVEAMGQVDVLVVPVGGHGLTLDATAAAQVVSQLEPKIVIPTHYDDGVSKYDMPQDKVDVFLKELGATADQETKLKLSAKDLPEELKVVVLKPE